MLPHMHAVYPAMAVLAVDRTRYTANESTPASMNPVIFQRCRIEAVLSPRSLDGISGPWFAVTVRFSEAGQPQVFHCVHLTEEAAALIAEGRATGMTVETLVANSIASSMLRNARYLVTGLEIDGQTLVQTVPKNLLRRRRWGAALSSAVAIGSFGWIAIGSGGWLSALVLVGATHALRTFIAIPHTSFRDLALHESLTG